MIERIELNALAIRMRRQYGADASSPVQIFSQIQGSQDLTLVLFPMGGLFSGMSFRVGSGGLIAVNSNMSYGRQRLAVAHELYHIALDPHCTRTICLQNLDVGDSQEQNANVFASFFIAPYEALRSYINEDLGAKNQPIGIHEVIRIEQHFGFSRQGILKRLTDEGMLEPTDADSFRQPDLDQIARLGYDLDLYAASPPERQYQTLGKYIKLAETLRGSDMISQGKYEELLLGAFRADIVFGTEGDDPPVD
jgi:Zn-dependent peptidase ImmA (M78 family)